ncbi:MAG: FTR1 family protein [Thermodesulfobacteriota bacterium]
MFSNMLITFRETLEAALVISVMLAFLNRTRQQVYRKYVWGGVLAGILASFGFAYVFNAYLGGFSGRREGIFEGLMMFLAATLLTLMIFWMMRQKQVVSELEGRVAQEIEESHIFGLLLLALTAVLREGVETVIFLRAATFLTGGFDAWGALIGIGGAVIVAALFFLEIRRVNIKRFFQVTSLILILFAAGLVAHGIHELQEVKLLPIMVEHLYDINWIINEKGFLGEMLKSLFGYNGNPSLLEVMGYLGYLTFALISFMRIRKAKPERKIDAQERKAKSAPIMTEELAPSGRG